MFRRTFGLVFLMVWTVVFGGTVWGASWLKAQGSVQTLDSSQEQDPSEQVNQNIVRLANSLWLQHRVNDAWATLNEVPEAERRLEWRLANQVFRGESLTLFGHRDEVTWTRWTFTPALAPTGA